MLRSFWSVVACDVKLAYGFGWDVVITLAFFVITAALFSISLQTDYQILPFVGPVSVLILALLANILNFRHIFEADANNGIMNLHVISPLTLEALVMAKALGHFIVAGLPILLISPFVLMFYNIPAELIMVTMKCLIVATITMSFLSVFAASLAVGAGSSNSRGALLMSLIVLPLFTPVLIFSMSAIMAFGDGLTINREGMILISLLLFVVVTIPWAAAAALRLR